VNDSTTIATLLVDDSPFARRALRRVLSSEPGIEVVGEAGDGAQALELVRKVAPDVVVLDLDMPVLDGLGVLEALSREIDPPAVVVVSSAARPDAELAIRALEYGAFDLVDKTTVSAMELHALGGEVASKIRAAAAFRRRALGRAASPESSGILLPELVVIGASTGGPQALFQILGDLPSDFPAPVAVVQHIPTSFLQPLIERIAEKTPLSVREGVAAEALRPGEVVFAGGKKNLEVVRKGDSLILVQRDAPPDTPHVPSIDALFASAARACEARVWGVLLTGMGRDGAEGLLEIRRRGGWTIVQDETTSAVYGMPKAAVALGAAAEILPLPAIGKHLARTAADLARKAVHPDRTKGATT